MPHPMTEAKNDPLWQLGDCALSGEIVSADVEKAYRRGFSQGWSLARQFLERGLTLEDLKRWEIRLMKWRRESQPWIKGQPVRAAEPPLP